MIKVYWEDDAKTILRYDYEAPVLSWGEYDHAIDEGYALIEEVKHRVDIIHNPGDVPMPKGNAIWHLRRAFKSRPANTSFVVAVVHNATAIQALNLIARVLLYKRFTMVTTLDDAHRVIQKDKAKAV